MGWKHRNSETKGNCFVRKCHRPFKKQCSKTRIKDDFQYQLEIKAEVIEHLAQYAQVEGNEQCGVLTGSQIDKVTFRVSKVSPPCVVSNSRFGCVRDATKANEFITHDYELSEHTRIYMGEWHTHPEPRPLPSGIDFGAIISNFSSSEIYVPFLLMVIVGTETICFNAFDGLMFHSISFRIID